MKAVVREHKDPTMVGLEIVNLLAEEHKPEIFAEELDHV